MITTNLTWCITYNNLLQSEITESMKDFPHSKLIVMAVLDTVQFAGLTVSAAGVSPAMTVILLHTSTPFLVLGSRYTFPDRKYSVIQMRGVQLIALSVFICLMGSLTHFMSHGVHESDAQSSILYVSMAALHGISLHDILALHPYSWSCCIRSGADS